MCTFMYILGTTVVFVTIGVFVFVDSTLRPLEGEERLLVSQRSDELSCFLQLSLFTSYRNNAVIYCLVFIIWNLWFISVLSCSENGGWWFCMTFFYLSDLTCFSFVVEMYAEFYLAFSSASALSRCCCSESNGYLTPILLHVSALRCYFLCRFNV